MVLFRHNAGPAIDQALFILGPLSNSTAVEGTVFTLARLDGWIGFVTEPVVGKESRGGCRQKGYTDAFTKVLPMARNQLIGSARQLRQHWHPAEFEVGTESESIDARKNFVFTMSRTALKTVTVPSVLKSVSSSTSRLT